MKYYYAVKKGRHPGIYATWDDCRKEVIGAAGAVYKKFESREEAAAFIGTAEAPTASYTVKAAKGSAAADPSLPLFHSISDVTKEDVHLEFSSVQTEALAYVDGSFNVKTGVYGYGGVLLCRDGSIAPLQGNGRDESLRTMRNVAGELHGAMAAIQKAAEDGIRSITLFYDYMGIEMWADGRWKTNKEGTLAYKAFIDRMRPEIELHFCKVAAHTGVRFNELVDQLAKAAVGITPGPQRT